MGRFRSAMMDPVNPMFVTFKAIVDPAQAREYNRLGRRLNVSDTVLSLAVLSILLFTGWTMRLRDLALHLSGQRFSIAVFFYVVMFAAIMKVAGFYLELRMFRLEHRFHLTDQKIGAWLWDQAKAWLLGIAFASVAAEVVYFFIRQCGETWWIWSWAVFVLFFVMMAQLAPVLLLPLFYKFNPLDDVELKGRLERMSQKAGVRVRGVYEWKLSEKSKKANAALTGLGATRRILLADTLLNGYTKDEIEAVLAHELGHHVHQHIVWGIIVQSLVSLSVFYVTSQVLLYVLHGSEWFQS